MTLSDELLKQNLEKLNEVSQLGVALQEQIKTLFNNQSLAREQASDIAVKVNNMQVQIGSIETSLNELRRDHDDLEVDVKGYLTKKLDYFNTKRLTLIGGAITLMAAIISRLL